MIALAWRNIWRQTRRSFITVSAMAFGAAVCMPMMAFMDGVYATMFDVAVTQQTGHVRVEHPNYPKTNSMFDAVGDAGSVMAALEGIPGASAVSWRAYGAGLLGSDQKSTGAVLVGVDPVREQGLANTDAIVKEGTWLTEPGQILLGHRLAADIQAELGAEIVIMTQAADGSIGAGTYTVAGLVRSGNIMRDSQGAWLSLADMQELLYLDDQVHELVLLAEGGRDNVGALTEAVQSKVGDGVLVRSWEDANPQMAEMLKLGQQQTSILLLIVFFLAGFGVLNTMLMSVFERTRELGVMMALGTRPSAIVRLILMEGFLLSVLGAIAGAIMGGLIDYWLCTQGLTLGYGEMEFSGVVFPDTMKGVFNINQALSVIGSMMLISVLAALWPAWRASRLQPVDAMRSN